MHSTAAGISDHCPLILSLGGNVRGHRRFHFESFWPSLEGFQEVVHQAWLAAGQEGGPLERLFSKMQATAKALQSWSAKRVGNVTDQLDLARELLHQLEMAQDRRLLSEPEVWLCLQLKQRNLALSSLQRTIARVRSRLD